MAVRHFLGLLAVMDVATNEKFCSLEEAVPGLTVVEPFHPGFAEAWGGDKGQGQISHPCYGIGLSVAIIPYAPQRSQ